LTGTIQVGGDASSVLIAGPPPNSTGNWAQIQRTAQQESVSTMTCTFSKFLGNGKTAFGTFPRDQVFSVTISLNITGSNATAHMQLFGTGVSRSEDYNVTPLALAQQLGRREVLDGLSMDRILQGHEYRGRQTVIRRSPAGLPEFKLKPELPRDG
jgi:hypothetical protein